VNGNLHDAVVALFADNCISYHEAGMGNFLRTKYERLKRTHELRKYGMYITFLEA